MWGYDVVIVSQQAALVWPKHRQSPECLTVAVVVVVDIVGLKRKIRKYKDVL